MMMTNKWLLTGIAAGTAIAAAAAAAVLRHADRPVPELSVESAAAGEIQAAELQAEAPAATAAAELSEPAVLPETGYLLKLHGNVLSVYEEGSREPAAEYDLPADWLPDYDRTLLEYGVRVSGQDELRARIEDYVS